VDGLDVELLEFVMRGRIAEAAVDLQVVLAEGVWDRGPLGVVGYLVLDHAAVFVALALHLVELLAVLDAEADEHVILVLEQHLLLLRVEADYVVGELLAEFECFGLHV